MKKIFNLTAPNKQPARQVDSVKYEIRKYITRERRKALPSGIDYWDFDCKFGSDATSATSVHVAEINKKIDSIVLTKADSCYIEILAKHGVRKKRESQRDHNSGQ